MKQFYKILSLTVLAVMFCASFASAFEEVRVFQPRVVVEEGKESQKLSPTQLRREALMLGFSEAVMQSALGLLSQAPTEERLTALRSFVKTKAGEWVLGYKEIAATPSDAGLSMVLEVDVNRRALRDVLESFGLDRPYNKPQYVTILPMPTVLEADKDGLVGVMKLVNAQDRPGSGPRISLARMESGVLRGELVSDRGSWTAMDADVESVWFALWQKYRAMGVSKAAGTGTELLVTGWFTPDGANDFDRVLNEWDDLVRSARLLEMDLTTEGVSARWAVQPMNMNGLQAKLRDYLPSRGLEFTLRSGQ